MAKTSSMPGQDHACQDVPGPSGLRTVPTGGCACPRLGTAHLGHLVFGGGALGGLCVGRATRGRPPAQPRRPRGAGVNFSLSCRTNPSSVVSGCNSYPLLNTCMSERMAALTPSPTFSSPDSDATEPAEEQSVGEEEEEEEEEEEDLQDDVFPEHVLCDGRDPFYDRPPLFSLVGRLVRLRTACWEGTSSFAQEHCCGHRGPPQGAALARGQARAGLPGERVRPRVRPWPSRGGPAGEGGDPVTEEAGRPGAQAPRRGPVSAERPLEPRGEPPPPCRGLGTFGKVGAGILAPPRPSAEAAVPPSAVFQKRQRVRVCSQCPPATIVGRGAEPGGGRRGAGGS